MKNEIKEALENRTRNWRYDASWARIDSDGGMIARIKSGANQSDESLLVNAPTWLKWQNERIEELEKVIKAQQAMMERICPACDIGWSDDEVESMFENDFVECICGYNQALKGAKP